VDAWAHEASLGDPLALALAKRALDAATDTQRGRAAAALAQAVLYGEQQERRR